MPFVQDEKPMATNELTSGSTEPEDEKHYVPAVSSKAKPGFFTIYKSGHGYWTRMGTVAGAALILFLMTAFLYEQLPVALGNAFATKDIARNVTDTRAKHVTLAICAGFVAVYSLIVFRLMNKPSNADFLIATDSEMKKVNWTSQADLIGSTKVVIGFMFMIAFLLFALDVIFGYFFNFIHVLVNPPF
jgi:preprotein translocase SecE subunit